MQSKQPNLGAIKIRLSILAPSEKVAAEPKARTELRRGPRHYGLITRFSKADNDCLFIISTTVGIMLGFKVLELQ
jgi:hypothetical protein